MSRGALLVLGLLVAAASVRCADRAAPEPHAAPLPPLLLTLAPRAEPDDPVVGLPLGSRIVRVDPQQPTAPPVTLTAGMAAAGRARVSYDGLRVLFIGREAPAEPWAAWSVGVDGKDRRRETAHEGDVGGACWLPDGRIAYSATVAGPAPVPSFRRAWALHVTGREGPAGHRITFGAGLDLDPDMLRDGRIVYATWLPAADGRPAAGAFALFAIHPDGSGATLYHGATGEPVVKRHPRAASDGRVLYLGGSDGEGLAAKHLRAHAADARVPTDPPVALADLHEDRTAAVPFADGALLGVAAPVGLVRLLAKERVHCFEFGPAQGELPDAVLDVTPAVAPPLPQGHLSLVDPPSVVAPAPGAAAPIKHAQVMIVDARPSGRPDAARIRWSVLEGTFDAGKPPASRALGDVDLAPDGSFFGRVPSDVPLLLEVLAADGTVISATRTPIWVRAGETRGCIGCHEAPDVAPPNRRPAAVLAPPVEVASSAPEPP